MAASTRTTSAASVAPVSAVLEATDVAMPYGPKRPFPLDEAPYTPLVDTRVNFVLAKELDEYEKQKALDVYLGNFLRPIAKMERFTPMDSEERMSIYRSSYSMTTHGPFLDSERWVPTTQVVRVTRTQSEAYTITGLKSANCVHFRWRDTHLELYCIAEYTNPVIEYGRRYVSGAIYRVIVVGAPTDRSLSTKGGGSSVSMLRVNGELVHPHSSVMASQMTVVWHSDGCVDVYYIVDNDLYCYKSQTHVVYPIHQYPNNLYYHGIVDGGLYMYALVNAGVYRTIPGIAHPCYKHAYTVVSINKYRFDLMHSILPSWFGAFDILAGTFNATPAKSGVQFVFQSIPGPYSQQLQHDNMGVWTRRLVQLRPTQKRRGKNGRMIVGQSHEATVYMLECSHSNMDALISTGRNIVFRPPPTSVGRNKVYRPLAPLRAGQALLEMKDPETPSNPQVFSITYRGKPFFEGSIRRSDTNAVTCRTHAIVHLDGSMEARYVISTKATIYITQGLPVFGMDIARWFHSLSDAMRAVIWTLVVLHSGRSERLRDMDPYKLRHLLSRPVQLLYRYVGSHIATTSILRGGARPPKRKADDAELDEGTNRRKRQKVEAEVVEEGVSDEGPASMDTSD